MAKKKHKKKHSFKHSSGASVQAQPTSVASAETSSIESKRPTPTTSKAQVNEWYEVRGDVRRVLWLALIFISFEILLSIVFNHTSIGPDIYKSIKL